MNRAQAKSLAHLLTDPTPNYLRVAQAAGYRYAYPYVPGSLGENCITLVSVDAFLWYLMHIEYRDDGIWIKVADREIPGSIMEVLRLLDGE